jgi:hypothetical protein
MDPTDHALSSEPRRSVVLRMVDKKHHPNWATASILRLAAAGGDHRRWPAACRDGSIYVVTCNRRCLTWSVCSLQKPTNGWDHSDRWIMSCLYWVDCEYWGLWRGICSDDWQFNDNLQMSVLELSISDSVIVWCVSSTAQNWSFLSCHFS